MAGVVPVHAAGIDAEQGCRVSNWLEEFRLPWSSAPGQEKLYLEF